MNAAIKYFNFGKVAGYIYDFDNAGDEIPMHSHDFIGNHITIIARGKFNAKGLDWVKEFSAGDMIDWPEGIQHSLIALEPKSRIININRNKTDG